GLTKLTASEAQHQRYTQPRWTPDGGATVYTQDSPDSGRTIWVRTLDGSQEAHLGSAQPFQTHPVVRAPGVLRRSLRPRRVRACRRRARVVVGWPTARRPGGGPAAHLRLRDPRPV